jgi:hypothetical protein
MGRAPRTPAAAARALLHALDTLLEEGIEEYALDSESERRRVFELTRAFEHAEAMVPALVARFGRPGDSPRSGPGSRPRWRPDDAATLVRLARHLVYWGSAGGADGGPALAHLRVALRHAEGLLAVDATPLFAPPPPLETSATAGAAASAARLPVDPTAVTVVPATEGFAGRVAS